MRTRTRTLLGALCAWALVLPLARAHAGLAGDCNDDGMVTINELVTAVNIALGVRLLTDCPAADADGDGQVLINDLVADVSTALGLSAATPGPTNATPTPPTPTDTATPSPTPTLPQVVLNGVCQRPAGNKPQNLRYCDDGTTVQAALCTNAKTCLHDPAARAVIGSTTVAGGAGQFAVSVPQVATGAFVMFEADLPDAQQVVFPYYAVYSFGSVGNAGLNRARRALQGQTALPTVVVDPSSEGTARVADLRGLDQFASDQVETLANEVRQDPRAQYGDLSLGCAADLGAGIAASYISKFFQGSVLEFPSALAVDADGNVFVAGGESADVFRISPDGEIRQIIDDMGDGAGHRFLHPSALAVDKAGNVFVAGYSFQPGIGTGAAVFRITPGGKIQQIIDYTGDGVDGHTLNGADALAVDATGDVFVAGSSGNVFRIAPAGTIQQIIDSTGDGAGHALTAAAALAVDAAGNVFVAGGNAVFRVTPSGEIRQIIDFTGDGAGHLLITSRALVVDAVGNVFVGSRNGNVFRITPAGTIQQIIDGTGDGVGHTLAAPTALTVDGAGNVFVAGGSAATSSVFRVTPNGEIQQIIGGTGDGSGHALDAPAALAADRAGNVFVAGGSSNNVFRIAVGGAIKQIIDTTGNGIGYTLRLPNALAIDATGNLFVSGAGPGSNNVVRIAPSGDARQIIDATGDGTGNALDSPRTLAVDGAGDLFVAAYYSSNVFRITPGGAIQQIIDATGDGTGHTLSYPQALAVDTAGNVLVAGGSNGISVAVFRITQSGKIQQIFDGTGDGAGHALQEPTAVVVDAAGNVFVGGWSTDFDPLSNAPLGAVFRISPDGEIRQIIDGAGDGAGHALAVPSALRVDAGGNVFVTGVDPSIPDINMEGEVFRISPSGEIRQIIDNTGDGAGHRLFSPDALAVDAAGNVFVGGANNVFRITPEGAVQQIIDASGDGAGHGLEGASALAVDAAGNVFVASRGNNAIFKISPCGFTLSVTP